MRHKDITKKVRDLLWKHVHGIYRLRSFQNIPRYEERMVCPIYKETETFRHIMVDCKSSEWRIIWQALNKIWRRQYDKDLLISEGVVLGCSLACFKMENSKPNVVKKSLYRILVSEAVHQIWVLRCERQIRGEDDLEGNHSKHAIQNRWYGKIDRRMQIDCLLTNTYLYKNKALKMKVVYNMWGKYSTSNEDLHWDWCRHLGVLVDKDPG